MPNVLNQVPQGGEFPLQKMDPYLVVQHGAKQARKIQIGKFARKKFGGSKNWTQDSACSGNLQTTAQVQFVYLSSWSLGSTAGSHGFTIPLIHLWARAPGLGLMAAGIEPATLKSRDSGCNNFSTKN